MSKYMVVRKQKGEGCDYMIGCGMDFEIVDVDSSADAIREYIVYPDGEDEGSPLGEDSESDLEEAWVIPLEAAIPVDLDFWRDVVSDAGRKRAAQEQREHDELELARLQKKLGK